MHDTLNEAQCIKLIEAKPIKVNPPFAKKTYLLSEEEKETHIQKIYTMWATRQANENA